MKIIPAIDLLGGNCVRLLKGDFDRKTVYSNEPQRVASQFASLDVTDLHVVDLDGARTGVQANRKFVSALARNTSIEIQLGGGIRSARDVERWLKAGVSRCVVGSAAVTDESEVMGWFERFGADRIVVALDVRIDDSGVPSLATHGWTKSSGRSLWECLDRYAGAGLEQVLCTDIDRDGALSGPNLDLYAEMLRRYPAIALQASGGVRNSQDLRALDELGVPAAITGRALLDGRITRQEVASFRQSA